jgi:hypothetical protein
MIQHCFAPIALQGYHSCYGIVLVQNRRNAKSADRWDGDVEIYNNNDAQAFTPGPCIFSHSVAQHRNVVCCLYAIRPKNNIHYPYSKSSPRWARTVRSLGL